MIDVPMRSHAGTEVVRKLPVVLPHHLVQQMLQDGLFDTSNAIMEQVQKYWGHLSEQGIGWARDSSLAAVHPLFLWGDDAQFNERQENLVVVAMGHVLSEEKNSMLAMWPLFSYKVEACHGLSHRCAWHARGGA